jgi:hypothetical protein
LLSNLLVICYLFALSETLSLINVLVFDENTPTRPLLAQPHSGENMPKLVTIKTSYKGSLLHHYVLLITLHTRSLYARPASRVLSRGLVVKSGTCGPAPTALLGRPSRQRSSNCLATSSVPVEQLKQAKSRLGASCPALPNLASYPGLQCLQPGCSFKTRQLTAIRGHVVTVHQIKAASHCPRQPLWRTCQLQTYFTGKGRIDYFEVASPSQAQLKAPPLALAKQALFASLEHSASTIEQDITEQTGIVRDLNASRTERVPWLEKTGFPSYLAGLQDSQIKSAYKLPPKDPAKATDSDRDLARILATAQALLSQAYQLCNKTSPDYKMTQ